MSDALKKNNLYIYDLSSDVLSSLELMVFNGLVSEVSKQEPIATTVDQAPIESNSKKCTSCGIELESLDLSRAHFKGDFHRYNLKRKINGLAAIPSEEFDAITAASDVESISGSESDSSSDKFDVEDIYSGVTDKLSTIFENEMRNLNISQEEKQEGESLLPSHLNTRSALLFLKSKLLKANKLFGIYKPLFNAETILNPLETINLWKQEDQSRKQSALFMIGGGHFAGAIVSHQRSTLTGTSRNSSGSPQEQCVNFLVSKTFHRYTTRRKQGGSQSTMDNAKGKANSAGSSLRRYNEAALKNDVQVLLKQWGPYLSKCENIFIRAKSASDKKIFTEGDVCLKKGDPRIKSFPFTTRRPTTNELKRVWCQLTYLQIAEKPRPVLKDPRSVNKVIATPKEDNKITEQVLTPAEKHTHELITLLKKSRAPQLVTYIKKNHIDVNFVLEPVKEYIQTPTMLHFAAFNSLKNMVLILLSTLKCNPTIENEFGKTAWDLGKKKDVKQAFQIARYNLGESFVDWEKSHIGKPLSREEVNEMNQKEAEQEQQEVEKVIKEELEIVRGQQKKQQELKRGVGRMLSQPTDLKRTMNSLTDDQRMKLMREQRARAAEARMRQNLQK